jgi:hypothetical protein
MSRLITGYHRDGVDAAAQTGGESASFVHLICADLGAVLNGGGRVADCRTAVPR